MGLHVQMQDCLDQNKGKEGVIPFVSLEKVVQEVYKWQRENPKEDSQSDYLLESHFQFLWKRFQLTMFSRYLLSSTTFTQSKRNRP